MGKAFVPLMAISFVVILGSFILLKFSSHSGTPSATPSPSPTTSSSPYPSAIASASPAVSATPDPYAGWRTYQNAEFGFSFRYPAAWGSASASAKAGSSGYSLTGAFSDHFAGFNIFTSDWSNGLGGPLFGSYSGGPGTYTYRYPSGSAGPDFSATKVLKDADAADALILGGAERIALDTSLGAITTPPTDYRYAFIDFSGAYAGSTAKGISFFVGKPSTEDADMFDRVAASFKAK